jgi:hypothetical protein
MDFPTIDKNRLLIFTLPLLVFALKFENLAQKKGVVQNCIRL